MASAVRLSALAAVALLASSSPLLAQGAAEQVGARFEVKVEGLPHPYASRSASNSPRRIERPADATLRVPDGFRVNIFADHLVHARWLAVAPNGDVFLTEPKGDRVTVLRDADGDGRAETVAIFTRLVREPRGVAVGERYIYVADQFRVWRFNYEEGALAARGSANPVTTAGALGRGGGHQSRTLVVLPKSGVLFVAVGSRGNLDTEPEPRATVQRISLGTGRATTYASGLRNPVGMALYPGTADLYAVVNERDGLGDGLVPDYLTRLRPGGFYGWPYAYLGPNPDPVAGRSHPGRVASTITPDLLFEAHSAPLGLAFYDGEQFPEAYRGDAFVALHGSWNSSRPTGYKVVRVPFKDGRPAGGYENFAVGFWAKGEGRAVVWGRPAGLAVAKDGSLLIADDVGQVIWRVSYAP